MRVHLPRQPRGKAGNQRRRFVHDIKLRELEVGDSAMEHPQRRNTRHRATMSRSRPSRIDF
jgi:hypothetical protein